MGESKENNPCKVAAEILSKDSSTSRLHLATTRIQGHYQLEAAKINGQAVIQSAKIGARARYFHGAAALLGALGVFGGFTYTIYGDNKKIYKQTKKLKQEIEKQDNTLKELAQSYDKMAELYSNAIKNSEIAESHEKSTEIIHRKKI